MLCNNPLLVYLARTHPCPTEKAMNVLKIINRGLVLVATAAVSSWLTYSLCAGKYERTVAELRERVSELQKNEMAAMVTKRISEQMEDIAFQQKTISDQQRDRAEQQSRIADMERGKAEIERGLAREAERQAVKAAHQADSMRLLAEFQSLVATQERQDALAARAKADTLFYNSLGKLLAQNSIAQSDAGSAELASLLSYASWHYTNTYGGDVYQQDVFTSLMRTSGNSMQLTGMMMGSVRSMAKVSNGGAGGAETFVAVSDYGEIASLVPQQGTAATGIRYTVSTIYTDKKNVFRAVCTDDNGHCYALDIGGCLVRQNVIQPVLMPLTMQLPQGRWENILQRKDGVLVAIAHDKVVWIDPVTMTALRSHTVEDDIVEAGMMGSDLLLFCSSGHTRTFSGYEEKTSVSLQMPRGEVVTAFEYAEDKEWLILGTETGPVYIYDRKGKLLSSLHGHTGRVTHMERMDWMLVSSSYDHTVRLWDMRHIGSLVTPVNISYSRWPLCFVTDEKQRMVRIGMEGGDIRSVNVSVETNSRNTHNNITREFSTDEWEYYIGKEVPYRRFKQDTP